VNKYVAELVGTFVLVFGGVGSAVLAGSHIGFEGVAFAFGLSLLAMVYTIGPISGCHINPAVTCGVFLAKKIGVKDAVAYVIFQIVGAIIAAAVILFIAKGNPAGYDASVAAWAPTAMGCIPRPIFHGCGLCSRGHPNYVPGAYRVGSTDIKAPVGFAGVAIGLVLTLIHLVGIPITNTSVNPARSIGPAIFVAAGRWGSYGCSSSHR